MNEQKPELLKGALDMLILKIVVAVALILATAE
jgi:hypothetical protein